MPCLLSLAHLSLTLTLQEDIQKTAEANVTTERERKEKKEVLLSGKRSALDRFKK